MRLCMFAGFVVSVLAVGGEDDAVKEELKKLEGKWVQVSVEADGKTLTSEKDPPTVTIRGDKWIEASKAGELVSTFKLDPTKKPKQIDLTDKDKKGKPLTVPGIYELRGNTLTVSQPFPFEGDFTNIGKRPTEFGTKPGDHFVTVIYKRQKP
jgi:uncharacterized protein (TIGR03067 family)